jgi:hypothetical protein
VSGGTGKAKAMLNKKGEKGNHRSCDGWFFTVMVPNFS